MATSIHVGENHYCLLVAWPLKKEIWYFSVQTFASALSACSQFALRADVSSQVFGWKGRTQHNLSATIRSSFSANGPVNVPQKLCCYQSFSFIANSLLFIAVPEATGTKDSWVSGR